MHLTILSLPQGYMSFFRFWVYFPFLALCWITFALSAFPIVVSLPAALAPPLGSTQHALPRAQASFDFLSLI